MDLDNVILRVNIISACRLNKKKVSIFFIAVIKKTYFEILRRN